MGVGTLLQAVTRRPERFRRLALVLPPTAWATRTAQAVTYRQTADLVDTHGVDALLARMPDAPILPLVTAGGWTFPPPDVAGPLFSAVLRGAADADFPDKVAIAHIQQPTLLLPWTNDPGHPVSTAEQLHELLLHSTLTVMNTVEDVQAIGAHVASFLN
jgi:3-oxoadipate enol-lactonase